MAAANADLTKDIPAQLDKLYGIGTTNAAVRTAATYVAPTTTTSRVTIADASPLATIVPVLGTLIKDLQALGIIK